MLSPERDVIVWFLGACKAAFRLSDIQMSDLSDEELIKELRHTINALEDYRTAIYTEDVESYVIARRVWDSLSSTRGGRLFLANLAMNVMTMYIDASRRSVEKPELRVEQLEHGMGRDSILSRLDPALAEIVKTQLRDDSPGFGEFVPGMYERTNGEDNGRQEGKEGAGEALQVPVGMRKDVEDKGADRQA